MTITPETLALAADTRNQIRSLSDQQVRDLVGAWVNAWQGLEPEYVASIDDVLTEQANGYVSQAKVRANTRLRQSLEVTLDELQGLADQANITISAAIPQAVTLGGVGATAIIGSQLPPGGSPLLTTWDRVDSKALAAIVKRSTQQITSTTRPLAADAQRVMRSNLIRGIAVGANPNVTARRIVKQAENGFNGGLTRALVLARTETLDAHREGSRTAALQNTDILTKWVWSASLDARTCPSCLANHGSEHEIDEPGPDDHQNGRCARIDKTKTWAELGFTGIEEPEDAFPDARAWFDNLTDDTQLKIMGPERLNLLQSGQIGWDDLTTKKSTDGWRDAMHVTPVKDLKSLAAPR
ncbi:phage minor head protein [Pseudarthrobacter sp. PS3-L1]|uniref:phage minor head protein n=1 Tax=Pseudarthrobacter sp. PS3-L1 TaxID=3046207 RepID=UPI0024B8D869|nr:phage minor head protein [Pseudarthrobacter sp. PS3-L1]MDJ0321840.1 phage minor head protein [Pseudarthrobacter sp. PS3-L1]